MCSKKFICHHSGYKKVPRKENQKGNSKNANCDSGIFVKVKLNTFRTRQSDQFVRKGMLAVITIKTLHTHTLDNAETLRCLPATESMKDTFFGYFNEGMGITESVNYHREEMEKSGDFQEDDFSNNRMNPSTRVVRHWHDEWKLLHLRS
ncbi:hypothetical protein JTE90_000550 [Oedothorax gibbosus]|uniref:Uncharacterized protein n=1 Tax=Oedothorax gibbosus TaxID=931172 RepID=A0AAV6VV91_9ARAC|nr:hypothetical protein JTE90_000550 [Oedothorax gibbosus]